MALHNTSFVRTGYAGAQLNVRCHEGTSGLPTLQKAGASGLAQIANRPRKVGPVQGMRQDVFSLVSTHDDHVISLLGDSVAGSLSRTAKPCPSGFRRLPGCSNVGRIVLGAVG